MSPAVRLALVGFTPFEREHLAAGLQTSGGHNTEYVVVDGLASCSVAVVNADHEPGVQAVLQQGRLASVVMLGTTLRPGAAAQLPRTIHVATLLRVLDDLVQASPPVSAAVQRVQEELARFGVRSRSAMAPSAGPAAGTASIIDGAGMAPPAAAASQRPQRDQILVVDENDAVLRFMATHLECFGFDVQLVRSGGQALARVARHHFDFVFMATGLDSVDGFHLCKTLKRSRYPGQRLPPAVVLLLEQDAAVEHLRARIAGADACLPKPLRAEALLQLLSERELLQHADAQTTRAANIL